MPPVQPEAQAWGRCQAQRPDPEQGVLKCDIRPCLISKKYLTHLAATALIFHLRCGKFNILCHDPVSEDAMASKINLLQPFK